MVAQEDLQTQLHSLLVAELDHFHSLRAKRRANPCSTPAEESVNKFNFLTFVVLIFNLVVSVNNNLNSNNNNNNQNSLNAVSQTSNNLVTNTNSVNKISVTILPSPGKRSTDYGCTSHSNLTTADIAASFLFDQLMDYRLQLLNRTLNLHCQEHQACIKMMEISRAFNVSLESDQWTGCLTSEC